ncbi:MAG: GTP-binding protein [Candidatus Lokiarchaeota archaeon]|nr:GTP-binding protein [Candidatus Lokiarchaeota archaeon]MBD3202081.1 GTP-binding protein [Candidatus Lokiarchaeota archaeon]
MTQDKEVLYTYKVVILGGGGVGKTCLFNRFCFNSFDFATELTIGVNFHSTYINIKLENKEYESIFNCEPYIVDSIFDFGGQPRFKPLIPKFIKGTDGAFLVFDSVSYASFQQLDYWYELLTDTVKKNIPILLIGSKSDLLTQTPKMEIVRDDLIYDFVEEKNIQGFYRTSALENYNVLKVFKKINQLMLEQNEVEAIVV